MRTLLSYETIFFNAFLPLLFFFLNSRQIEILVLFHVSFFESFTIYIFNLNHN